MARAKTPPRKTAAKKKAAPKKAPAKRVRKPKPKVARKPDAVSRKAKQGADRQAIFVREYLVDLNGRQAAIRAGYAPGSARFTASELLARPAVQEAVAKAMVERATRTGITADRVLERLWGIATADPRELIELHRACCRYCYGEGHRYQRTPRELDEAREEYAQWLASEHKAGSMIDPDTQGGTGYNPRLDPNPACPECFGDGVERVIAKDTRDLSPDARLLYAGVKTTQHGLEIKVHDQAAQLVNVGKHLGLFRERVELTMPQDFEATLLAARKRALDRSAE